MGEGGGSDAGSTSARRELAALATATTGVVNVDFDSGTDLESGAAVSALAPYTACRSPSSSSRTRY